MYRSMYIWPDFAKIACVRNFCQYFTRMVMGRPKKPDAERRSTTLRIRLTRAERTDLDQLANACGMDTSTWAREELLAKRGRKKRTKTP
jgi:hypothetical protein